MTLDKSICYLPEWYVDVPPSVVRSEKAQPPDMGKAEVSDDCFISSAMNEEYEWHVQVKMSVNRETCQGETPVAWT